MKLSSKNTHVNCRNRQLINKSLETWEEVLATGTLFETSRPSGEGVLPSQEIRALVSAGIICSTPDITDEQIQPSSIDLRLSREAYQVKASFLPGTSTTLLNKAKSNGMLERTIDISGPTRLERNVIYVIPLMESLELPSDVYGIANPKSTTGRLDIFTRLITESGDEFDRVRKGYKGKLYIEVLSQTFPIIVQAGMRLNQLRFGRGKFYPTGDDRLKQLHRDDHLLGEDEDAGQSSIDRGLRVTIDLQGNGSGIVGYQAIKGDVPIDLSKIAYYDIAEFWTPILRNEKRQFILKPGEFYILASKQRIRVKPNFAAEMLPYDLATQEFRVHYAGFFDPGFGYGINGEIPGTRAVLEVRASQMPILLEDDQFVGRLNYYKMSDPPDIVYGGKIGSSYQLQGLALSKQFKRSEQYSTVANPDVASLLEANVEIKQQSDTKATRSMESDDDDHDSVLSIAFPGAESDCRIEAKNK
jgi:dCTP deaminase